MRCGLAVLGLALACACSTPAPSSPVLLGGHATAAKTDLAIEPEVKKLVDAELGAALDLVDAANLALLKKVLAQAAVDAPVRSMAAFRLGLLSKHQGAWGDAERYFAQVQSSSSFFARAQTELKRAKVLAAVVPGKVAVLLPLSGPYKAIGAEVRAGVELALGSKQAIFLDTEGKPERAKAMVDEAAFKHRVSAILGPIGDAETRSAIRRAAELRVPIAHLSPRIESQAASAIFALITSERAEAAAAAQAAIAAGFDAFAILHPRDEAGAAQAEAFARAAKQGGARVITLDSYDPSGVSLEQDVRRMLGFDPKRNRRLRKHLRRFGRKAWKSFSPNLDFDLIYIPDDYRRAALVASYLPYFNVEVRGEDTIDMMALRRKYRGSVPSVVQLLGSSGWHHPALFTRGGPAVEGALVVDVFSGGQSELFSSSDAEDFARRFRKRRRRDPSPLAAQGFDAATLFMQAASSAQSRKAFAQALLRAQLFSGACGRARVGPNGAVQRPLTLLRADNGEFIPSEGP